MVWSLSHSTHCTCTTLDQPASLPSESSFSQDHTRDWDIPGQLCGREFWDLASENSEAHLGTLDLFCLCISHQTCPRLPLAVHLKPGFWVVWGCYGVWSNNSRALPRLPGPRWCWSSSWNGLFFFFFLFMNFHFLPSTTLQTYTRSFWPSKGWYRHT